MKRKAKEEEKKERKTESLLDVSLNLSKRKVVQTVQEEIGLKTAAMTSVAAPASGGFTDASTGDAANAAASGMNGKMASTRNKLRELVKPAKETSSSPYSRPPQWQCASWCWS